MTSAPSSAPTASSAAVAAAAIVAAGGALWWWWQTAAVRNGGYGGRDGGRRAGGEACNGACDAESEPTEPPPPPPGEYGSRTTKMFPVDRDGAMGDPSMKAAEPARRAVPEFYVIVNNVAKKANVGTMVRSAAAFGATAMLIAGRKKSTTFFGSFGSNKHLKIMYFDKLEEAGE